MALGRRPSLGVKLALSLIVTFLLLGVLEAASRLLGLGRDGGRSYGRFEEQVHLLLRRGLFVRDPDLFWTLRPVQGLDTPIAPGGLRVSEAGMRGPLVPKTAPAGVRRIVTLGDSTTFGWAVSEQEAYPVRLEQVLRERGHEVEVINAGIPGYTSYQALRFLERDLLDYGPDVVTLCFGWNELWPARGQSDLTQAVSGWKVELENVLDHSHLYRLLRRGYVALRTDLGTQRTAQTVPRVSPQQYRQVLDRLAELCKRHGVELVLLTQPARTAPHARCWSPPQHALLEQMHLVTREAAAAHGLVLVDLAALLRAQDQDAAFVDCVHPAAGAHLSMAAALAGALEPKLRGAGSAARASSRASTEGSPAPGPLARP
jgi:lysophospholipase L1-like esterase